MMLKNIKFLAILTTLVILPIFIIGCDGGLSIKGIVYEWVNAPLDAKGQVIIDQDIPTGRILEPVNDVTIRFGHRIPEADNRRSEFLPPSISDANGVFVGFWLVYNAKGNYTVWVDQSGYYSLVQDFTHIGRTSTGDRMIYILLVRSHQLACRT